MADRDKLASVENSLVHRYNEKGFLLEDEVIDCCIDHDLDLAEIDAVCDRLLKRNIIFRDSATDHVSGEEDDDDVYDRSHLDYDEVLDKIKREYPSCETIVEQIRSIMPPQHKEWRTLIVQAQSGNKYAKERLVSMYLRTMMKQAYSFAKTYYCDFEDCFQNAVIGLLTAVSKYDTTSPDSFVSYFPLWAQQVMNRDCFVNGTMLRFPVHYKEQFLSFVNGFNETDIGFDAIAELDQRIIEECEQGDYDGRIYDALQESFEFRFRDEIERLVDGKFDYNHIMPYLPIIDEFTYEDDFVDKLVAEDNAASLRQVLDSCLREKERDVIMMRYGLDDGQAKTLEEVGTAFGVTRERVRQIESKALRKLKIHYKIPVE